MSTKPKNIREAYPPSIDVAKMPSDPITFSVRSNPVEYGDRNRRTFHEFQILMHLRGRVVGSESGPRRTHESRRDARAAGYVRVRVLKTHRLFAVRVTRADIANGEARSCESCAIAQALYRNQERMGFPKWNHSFSVAPYAGMFSTAYGISLFTNYPCEDVATGDKDMPDMVFATPSGVAVESMMEWSQLWDDWAERRHMTIAEWREERGYDDGETPCTPWPVSFVLDLDAMKP